MNLDYHGSAIIDNLRRRWPDELAQFTDKAILECYSDFQVSEDFGNNDEKFPDWFEMLGDY